MERGQTVDEIRIGGFLAGRFLIASPALLDRRFYQAVIYMCVHDSDHAMGIMINRPKPDLKLTEMLPHLGIDGAPWHENNAVLYGGPVEKDRGFVLHSRDFMDEDNSLPVSDTLAMTTSKQVLEALVRPSAPRHAVLALGYTGWHGGQLEAEIANNSWLVAPAIEHIVFSKNQEEKWTESLASIGVAAPSLSAQAGQA